MRARMAQLLVWSSAVHVLLWSCALADVSIAEGGLAHQPVSVISWASHPVLPGQVLVLQGRFPTATCDVSFESISALPGADASKAKAVARSLQQTPVSIKVRVPSTLPVAAYNVSACGSPPASVNLPDIWWTLGDEGDTATPGGWIRAYGRSVSRGDPASAFAEQDSVKAQLTSAAVSGDLILLERLLREANGAKRASQKLDISMTLTGAGLQSPLRIVAPRDHLLTPYSAAFPLPASIAPGVYTASFANDFAPDVFAPFNSFLNETTPVWTTVQVAKRAAEPKAEVVVPVGDMDRNCFNASSNILPPGSWRCATAALRSALQAAARNGGGIVSFPQGQFYLEEPVSVPRSVKLVGAGMRLTALYFREIYSPQWNKESETAALFACDQMSSAEVDSSWAMSDLTVYVTAWYPDIIYVKPGQRFRLQRVRIIANAFFAQNVPTYHPERNCTNVFAVRPTRGRDANYSATDVGAVVRSHGRNVIVRECDLFGTGDVITSAPIYHKPNHTEIGMQWGLFEGNTIHNGGASHMMPQWEQVSFTNNTIVGASLTSMGQAVGTSSSGAASHVFEGQNHISSVWGNDREILTYDDAGGAYWGHATVTGTNLKLHADPMLSGPSQLRVLVMILNGTGAHECSRVVRPGGMTRGDDVRTWGLDRPFSAAVADGSAVFIQIMPARIENLHVPTPNKQDCRRNVAMVRSDLTGHVLWNRF